MEVQPKPLRVAHVRDLAVLEQPIGGKQVNFLQGAVQSIAVPFRRGEAFVAAFGRLHRVGADLPAPAPPVTLQMSTADCQMAAFSSETSCSTSGRVKERNHTIRSAQAMPAQSTGITACNGFVFQTCSIDFSSGSCA